ncbi:MAG: type IV pilin [Candidatus Thermoplasmatota archaeon]|nr:type IV pilin [Candidatus Thermoplasmatota archaeon]
MSLYRKRFSRDNNGVAEVVGTILILLITVVIFSTIFIWVYSIPTPEASTKLQMEGALDPIYDTGVWDGAIINITHQGGENLYGWRTQVYIRVNNEFEILETQGTISYGPNSGDPYGLREDGDWFIGEVWSILNHTIQPDDRVEVGVVESIKGEVIWSSLLLGAAGEHPPLFVQKWYDGNLDTIAREDLRGNESFAIYVQIVDNDGDFDSGNPVYANVTVLYADYGAFKMYDNGSMGDALADDGIWTANYTAFEADESMDGSLVIITAEDDAGHNTTARLILKLRETTTIYIPTPPPDYNITTPRFGPELLPGSGLQHYQIFNETEWDKLRWVGNASRTFVKGERIVIVIASHFLPDTNLDNKFWLFKAESGLGPQPVVYGGGSLGPNSIPSSTEAFELVDYVGKFYVWECRWNTSSEGHGFSDGLLDYGHYSLRIKLRSSYYPPPDNLFEVMDFITVTDEDGNFPDYPMVQTFLDANHEQPSDTFNYTDIMYVKVVVQDTDGSFEFGNVKIQDFGAGIQIWAKPGNPPVSAASVNNSVSYKFNIDLTKPNFDPWLFGENAYTLRVLYLKDINEEYKVSLSRLVTIRGPRWYLDIAHSIEGYDHPTHDDRVYAVFLENLVFRWEDYWIESYNGPPNQRDPPWGGGAFLSIVFGDLDDDTDLDVVTGLEVGRLFMYRNQGGNGHFWQQREVDNLGMPVTAVDVGHVDKDGLLDIVAGTEDGHIWWYASDNQWTPTLIVDTGLEIHELVMADMDDDDDDDLVVATGNDLRVYENSDGVFGTITTLEYFAEADIGGNGTVVPSPLGFEKTKMSDDDYESITEVSGIAYNVSTYTAQGEVDAQYEDPKSGDYTNTKTEDGSYEVLREKNSYPLKLNGKYRYLIRNWTGNLATHGHAFLFGDVPNGDLIKLYINSYISNGTTNEPFNMGWSNDWTANPTYISDISRTTIGTDEFNLKAAGFTGGPLIIWIWDDDHSEKDITSLDEALSWLSIDYMGVKVFTANGTTSTLDHIWRTDSIQANGHAYKFFLEAYHDDNAENDHFTFQYSQNQGGPWTDMVTIVRTSDPNDYTGATLPTTVAGNAYIKVIDTDGTNGRLNNDTVYVDHMFIRRYYVSTTPLYSIDLGSTVNSIAVGDVDGDGDNDVAAATSSGNIYVRYNDGLGDLGLVDVLAATGSVLQVDLAYIDGDDALDVVAGTDDNKVYWFENALPQTSWDREKIADTDGDVTALRAGDVNGDYWDDIVIGTDTGKIVWYKNERPGWKTEIVDSRNSPIYDLDIGDVDRGVTIELERD